LRAEKVQTWLKQNLVRLQDRWLSPPPAPRSCSPLLPAWPPLASAATAGTWRAARCRLRRRLPGSRPTRGTAACECQARRVGCRLIGSAGAYVGYRRLRRRLRRISLKKDRSRSSSSSSITMMTSSSSSSPTLSSIVLDSCRGTPCTDQPTLSASLAS
jgi:hypothetical protein